MRLDPLVEQCRAHDDRVLTVIKDLMVTHPDGGAFVVSVYNRIKDDIRNKAPQTSDHAGCIAAALANVGFWTVVEALERDVREANP
jgi:long-subunit acyl-CoA synthetase (AMP-forming)